VVQQILDKVRLMILTDGRDRPHPIFLVYINEVRFFFVMTIIAKTLSVRKAILMENLHFEAQLEWLSANFYGSHPRSFGM
jgi:hypothetical protein